MSSLNCIMLWFESWGFLLAIKDKLDDGQFLYSVWVVLTWLALASACI